MLAQVVAYLLHHYSSSSSWSMSMSMSVSRSVDFCIVEWLYGRWWIVGVGNWVIRWWCWWAMLRMSRLAADGATTRVTRDAVKDDIKVEIFTVHWATLISSSVRLSLSQVAVNVVSFRRFFSLFRGKLINTRAEVSSQWGVKVNEAS